MKPRRAIFVRPGLGLGGAERWAVDATVALREAGWEAGLWVNSHDPRRAFPETVDGRAPVRVVATRFPAALAGRLRVPGVLIRQALLLRALARAGEHAEPELFVVDLTPHIIPWIRRRWPRSAVLAYGHYPDRLLAPAGGPLYRLYRGPIDRREARGWTAATRIVVNSRHTAAAMRRVFPALAARELPVVYPGVRLPVAAEPAGRPVRTLLTVARLDPRKQPLLALEAFAALRARVPASVHAQCRWILAGGFDEALPEARELVATLRRRIGELALGGQVRLCLNVSEEALAGLWAGADALVHPVPDEHFGIVPVEAMGWARPVLAVNAGGPCETVVDGVTGALRPPEPAAFAEVLAGWIVEPMRAAELGAAGRRRAVAEFGMRRFAEAFVREAAATCAGGQR